MRERLAQFDGFVGRAVNRIIRATPGRTMSVPIETPIVSFTFDDVPDSALSAGAAILEAHGARGTFYIAGGLEGRQEANRTLITADGCRDLAARGHEIGCHTFSHRNLRHMSGTELQTDLERNARYLDSVESPRAQRNFAFPYNGGSLTARRMLRRRYRTCRAAGEGVNRGTTDPGFLRAVEIRQPDAYAATLTRWIDDLVGTPGWLIFFTHDIAPEPTAYGCTPETFERLVAHAAASGCVIATVDAALDRMGLPDRRR